MPKLSSLCPDREVKVDFDGEEISLTVNTGVLTPAYVKNLNTKENKSEDESQDETIQFFLDCVKKWDLEDENGRIPLNKANLYAIPYSVLNPIMTKVMETINGNFTNAGN